MAIQIHGLSIERLFASLRRSVTDTSDSIGSYITEPKPIIAVRSRRPLKTVWTKFLQDHVDKTAQLGSLALAGMEQQMHSARWGENRTAWGKLAVFKPPVASPEITYDLMWHRRNDSHPTQQWLRDQIVSLSALM